MEKRKRFSDALVSELFYWNDSFNCEWRSLSWDFAFCTVPFLITYQDDFYQDSGFSH